MDTAKLYEILRKTCSQLRKGEVVEHSPGVTEVYMMPKEDDPAFAEQVKVNMHFITVAVNKTVAEAERDSLIELLNNWPEPEMLAGGPSYIAVGGVIGDQGAAFELFALGKVLGIWDIITPEVFGIKGEQADQMAGAGYIMCTGYKQKER